MKHAVVTCLSTEIFSFRVRVKRNGAYVTDSKAIGEGSMANLSYWPGEGAYDKYYNLYYETIGPKPGFAYLKFAP